MQKTLSEIQAIFLPATNERQKVFFKNYQLGAMAILCAVFPDRFCLDLVLYKSKIIVVLQFFQPYFNIWRLRR